MLTTLPWSLQSELGTFMMALRRADPPRKWYHVVRPMLYVFELPRKVLHRRYVAVFFAWIAAHGPQEAEYP